MTGANERPPTGVPLETNTCRTLLDAWLAWRGDRLLPRYSDLDPASIRKILPYVTVFEIRARDVAVIRLTGSGLRDIVGFDATGREVVEMMPKVSRLRRAYRLFVPATHPCGYFGNSKFTYTDGVFDWFETIGLPLEASESSGYSFIVSTLESLRGRRWQRVAGSFIDNSENEYRFLDIGAGTPASVDPPPDFLTDKN